MLVQIQKHSCYLYYYGAVNRVDEGIMELNPRLIPDDEVRFQRPSVDDEKISQAIEVVSVTGGIEARAAIYTRAEIVDFMLDLSGYSPSRDLAKTRLLEPSFGGGDFLLAAIRRLMASWRAFSKSSDAIAELSCSICAVELHEST